MSTLLGSKEGNHDVLHTEGCLKNKEIKELTSYFIQHLLSLIRGN